MTWQRVINVRDRVNNDIGQNTGLEQDNDDDDDDDDDDSGQKLLLPHPRGAST